MIISNSIHTAEAAPIPARNKPFSFGPILKYSMFITGPKAWINIAGAKEAACANNMYNTCGILNKSYVFVRIDLSWLLESMEGNKRLNIGHALNKFSDS